jgi:hypothetical protein
MTPGGERFHVQSCWNDIYDSISSAERFVYLTGWSFHPLILLVRDNPAKSKPLGELLKDASERGCEVYSCHLSFCASFEHLFSKEVVPFERFRCAICYHSLCHSNAFGSLQLASLYAVCLLQQTCCLLATQQVSRAVCYSGSCPTFFLSACQ